ncbi:MAG: hypothetical protein J7L15_04760 [Clostridiales bacterium]|nr:hypothetical protein [Clostridiales bacterium]
MNKNFKALIESTKYAPLDENQQSTIAAVMENTAKETERMIAEGTIAADVAQFTPFLMPMLRKVYPALIANELLGVQPLSGPTGFIYSLTNRLVGTASDGIAKAGAKTNAATQILVVTGTTAPAIGETITQGALVGTVVYAEPVNHGALGSNIPAGQTVVNSLGQVGVDAVTGSMAVLVELPANISYLKGSTSKFVTGSVVNSVTDGTEVTAYTGLAAFDKILPNYSGSYTTANGETRGVVGNEMKEVGIAVERTQVEAKTKKLRAEYTIEMYQDLKAMHGVLADQELMSLMGYEIKAETDREVVDFVNSRAGIESDFYMNGSSVAASAPADGAFNSGRWEIERYRSLAIKIADMSRNIGRLNKRGAANKLLVSPKVLTALEAIGGFSAAPVGSTVSGQNLNPVAGRFDNKYNVIVDNYAENDYVTAIYKGSNQDSLGVYAPYTPVQIQKVTHVTTGQPALIAMSRYGMAENPWGGENYATSMGINFDATVLA